MEEENKKTQDLDYEAEYERLREKYCQDIAEIQEEHQYNTNEIINKYENELTEKDELYRDQINTQEEEIKWLKSIIRGILHISY